MRQQLVPGIDAHLGTELAALRRLDIEREDDSAVGVVLVGGGERGLPQPVTGGLRVGREWRRRQVRLRQQPPRGELHPHVGGCR